MSSALEEPIPTNAAATVGDLRDRRGRCLQVGLLVACLVAGCDAVDMSSGLQFDERGRLVRSVEAVVDAQERTLEEFREALKAFDAVFNDLTIPLADRFAALEVGYRRVARNATRVQARIEAVAYECNRLFMAWDEDIPALSNDSYRISREVHLQRSRSRCERVLRTMRETDRRLVPLLDQYRRELLVLRRELSEERFIEAGRRLRGFHRDMQTAIFALRDSIVSANAFIALLQEALLEAPT